MQQYFELTLLLVMIKLVGLSNSSAQVFDKYGGSIGLTYATQDWDDERINPGGKDYTLGLSLMVFGEHALDEHFHLRAGIGYVQKGFEEHLVFNWGDSTSSTINDDIVLHNISMDVVLKVAPTDRTWSPYAIIGLSGNYLFTYRDITVTEPSSGQTHPLHESILEQFNTLSLGGLIGLGLEWNELLYMEMAYNPSLTPAFESGNLEIRDYSWNVTLGMNFNALNE